MLCSKAVRGRINASLRSAGVPAKVCSKCLVVKALTQFAAHKSARGGIRSQCKECTRTASRAWCEKNKAARAAYRSENRESAARYNKQWRANNPGAAAKHSARWAERHPVAKREADSRRRAVKAEAEATKLTAAEISDYWKDRGWVSCVYCGEPWEHIDHRMPIALGGGHTLENLQPLCAYHNLSKGAKHPDLFEAQMATQDTQVGLAA